MLCASIYRFPLNLTRLPLCYQLSEARASLLEMTKQQDLAVSAKLQLQRELGDAEVAVQREKMAAGRAEGLLASEQIARQVAEDEARRTKVSLARVQTLQQASVQAVDLTNKDLAAAAEREQTLRTQISALEEQLRNAHDTTARQATAMAGLEVELASSAQTLKQTIESERAGVTALADAQNRASEQIEALQARLEQQTAVNEQMRLDLAAAATATEAIKVSLAAAQQRGNDAEAALVTAEGEISTLREGVVAAETAHRDLMAQLEAEKLAAATKATALQDSDTKVAALQEDITREVAVRVVAEEAAAALRLSLAEAADRCAEADAACEDLRRSADVVCEDLRRQLDQSSASFKVELDQFGMKVAEQDQLLAERGSDILAKEGQLETMRGVIDYKVRIISELEGRIEDFGGQIVDKVRVEEDLVAEKDRYIAELSMRTAEHDAAMQASAAREADLKQTVLVLEEQQCMLQKQAKIAEDDAQTTRNNADSANEVTKSELANLRTALDMAEALNASRTSELAMQQKEYEAEVAKRLEMEQACVDLRQQLDEGTSELLVRQAALQVFVATHDAEVSSLKERLDECQHVADAAAAAKAMLENELNDVRAQSVDEAKAWQVRLVDLVTEQANGYESRRSKYTSEMRTAFDKALGLVRSELAIIRSDTVTHEQHAAASFGSAMLQVQQRLQRVEGEREAQASLLTASEERNVRLRDELETAAALLQTLEAEACKPLGDLADTDNHITASSLSAAEATAEMLGTQRDALQSTIQRLEGELAQASQLCSEQCTALGEFAVKQLRADAELRSLREQVATQVGITPVTSVATATAATETDNDSKEALIRQEYEEEKAAMQTKLQQFQQQQHQLSAGTTALEDRCESLQYDLANKSRMLASLSDDLAAARETTAMLEGDLRVAEDRLRQSDGRETTLLLELQEAKTQQQKYRTTADAEARAERALADVQAALGEAHRREDFLRSQLAEVTRQQGQCEEQVETLKSEKSALREAVAAAHGVSAALDEQLAEARDVIAGLRRRFEESEIRVAVELQARHAAAAATTTSLTAEGNKEYEAERARRQRLEEEFSAARATHTVALAHLHSAERESEGLRLEMRALQISLEGARRETVALTSQTEEMLGAITAQAAALEIAEQRELEHCAQKNKLQDQVLRAQERARDALVRLELVEKEHRVALAAASASRQASQSRLVEDLQLEVAAMHRSLLIAREETAAKEAELEALAAQVTDLISQSLLSPMRPTALTPTRTDAERSETGAMAVLLESLEQGRRSVVDATKGSAAPAVVGRREALADVTTKVVDDARAAVIAENMEDFVVDDTDDNDARRDLALEALLSLHEALSACCRSWVAVYGHRQASDEDKNGALQEQALIRASTALRAAYDLLQDPRCSGDGPAPSLPPLPLPCLLTAVPQSPPPPPPPSTTSDEDGPRFTREPPRYANRRDADVFSTRPNHVPSSSSVTAAVTAEEEVGSDENCDPLAPPPPPPSLRTAVPQSEGNRLNGERELPKFTEKMSIPAVTVVATPSMATITTLTGSPTPVVASSVLSVASPPSSSGRKTMMGERLRLSQQQHLQPNHLGLELGLASDPAGTSSGGYGSAIEDRLLGLGPPRNTFMRASAVSSTDTLGGATIVSSSSAYMPISVSSLAGRGGELPQASGVTDESFDSTVSQASHFWNVSTDSESDLALTNTDRHRSRMSSNDSNRSKETMTVRQQQQGTMNSRTTSTTSVARTDLYISESEDYGFCNFDDND